VDLDKGTLTPLPQGEEDDVPMSEWMQDLIQFQAELHTTLRKSLEEVDKCNVAKRIEEVTQFTPGSLVLLSPPEGRFRQGSDKKLRPIRKGPMRVKSYNKDIYTLEDLVNPNRTMEVHVSRLSEFRYDPTHVNPVDIALSDASAFVVQKVLDHRLEGTKLKHLTRNTRKSNIQFLVKWEGYDHPDDNTWEPWSEMRTVKATHDYLREKKFESLIPIQFR
jgi:hypothetical protein